jgi:hypothetical protein
MEMSALFLILGGAACAACVLATAPILLRRLLTPEPEPPARDRRSADASALTTRSA